ncbi:reverse transcriptase domain-containing protein [Tanacetum coccineum]
MRTRSSSNLIVESSTIPKRCNRRRSKQIVKPELRTIVKTLVATMADTRTMSELLQASTESPGIWLEKEPPRSILTWEDLVSKFVNHFFPSSKTKNLKNDITNFQQRFDESFGEAWDHFKDLLCKCLHHGFSELHQIDTFYNALTQSDQDSLNAAADGNLLNCTPRDALTIIENKSKRTCVTCAWTTSPTLRVLAPVHSLCCKLCETVGPLTIKEGNGLPSSSSEQGTRHTSILRLSETIYGIPEPEVVPKPNLKPSIPYPSRLNNQKLQEKTNNQMMKFLQIFQRLHLDNSFMDALLHMPNFASTFKSLLSNKEKLFELASTPLNDNCSAVLLKKLPENLGDPIKFLIPCDFPELDECLALADLGASINLMPLSVWKKLSLPELTPTLDYDVDPRVPLILRRPFLRTKQALIDVHGEELTLRVNDEAITIKFGHTSRYSRNYYDESVNQINVIDVACAEYAQEVLGFSDSSTSGNATPSDPIIASSSPSFTPFEGGYFILEEIETFLHTPNNPSNLDDYYYDTEGDILYLEKLLNEDPSPNLPPMKNEDLKQVDVTMTKPSIE